MDSMEYKFYHKDKLTIKEFSKLTDISVSTLRNYDKLKIFQPAFHGEGTKSTYRYYSPTQITAAKMIRVLTEMEVSLEKIKELSKERTPELLLKLLRVNKDVALAGIRFYQDVYSVIEEYIGLLHEGISAMESQITVEELPPRQILLGAATSSKDTLGFVREFTLFCSSRHEPKLNTSFPVGGYWDSMKAFLENPSLPNRFYSLDPNGHEQKTGGLYLVGYTRGYYSQVSDLPKRMVAYAEENGLEFAGPVYNQYLFDELSVSDQNQYLLQASALVLETRRERTHRRHNHF